MKTVLVKKELQELVKIKNVLDEGMPRLEYEKTHREMMEIVDKIVEKLK